MAKDSVNTEVILTKIYNSDCCFQVTSSDIVDLTKNKVPSYVIQKMICAMGDRQKREGERKRIRARNPRMF